MPQGWDSEGGCVYRHESGSLVQRQKNPESRLIEWCVEFGEGEFLFTGQDLLSAFEYGARR